MVSEETDLDVVKRLGWTVMFMCWTARQCGRSIDSETDGQGEKIKGNNIYLDLQRVSCLEIPDRSG